MPGFGESPNTHRRVAGTAVASANAARVVCNAAAVHPVAPKTGRAVFQNRTTLPALVIPRLAHVVEIVLVGIGIRVERYGAERTENGGVVVAVVVMTGVAVALAATPKKKLSWCGGKRDLV